MRDRSNFWTQRWKRRRFVQGSALAAGGAASLALVGCGDDDDDDDGGGGGETPDGDPTQEPTSATGGGDGDPVAGGRFVVHMGDSPRSLDPHFDTFPYCTAVVNNVYNNVLRFSPDLTEMIAEAATGMPEQPDDMTYTFKLNAGINWQNLPPLDGRPLTADDVKYSIERQATDEPGVFQHAYFFKDRLDGIDVLDDETITFRTSGPYAPFLSYIASPWTPIIPREVVEQEGDLTEVAIGTGPFILDEWQKDVKFELRKNPDYWEDNLPYVDELAYIIATDADTAATLYTEGDVDAIAAGFAQLSRIQDARPDDNYKPQASQFWRQMRMPPTTAETDPSAGQPGPYQPPFDNIQFREAVVRAVDKEAVLDFVYDGDGQLTYGPILPIYTEWALTEELAPFDLNEARALAEASGQTPFTGPMIWATGTTEADDIATILQEMMAEIDITLDLQPLELAEYYNQTYSYQYTFSHHVPLNSPDPDENLSSYFGRNSTFFKHHNEEIFDLIDQQATTVDTEERKQIVDEVQRKIVLDFPMRFMHTTNLHLFTPPKVKGWFYPVDLYNGRKAEAWIDPNA